MAAPLSVCTKEEQSSVMRFFCGLKVYQGPKYIEDFQHNTGTVFCLQRSVYEWIEKFKKCSHMCYAWRKSRRSVHGHNRQQWARTWHGSVRQTIDYWRNGKSSANYWQAEAWHSKQTPRTTAERHCVIAWQCPSAYCCPHGLNLPETELWFIGSPSVRFRSRPFRTIACLVHSKRR